MAFCTKCGHQLPPNAAFCPYCGFAVAQQASGAQAVRKNPNGGYKSTFQHAASFPAGYSPSPAPVKKKNNAPLIIGIVVAVVLALFFILWLFGYITTHAFHEAGSDYAGYWESASVEVNGKANESYFGTDVDGLFGIELNSDGSAAICSAYTNEVHHGQWYQDSDKIMITGEDSGNEDSGDYNENNAYDLTIKDGKLYYFNSGLYVVFEKSNRDIDHPSVAHGSLSQQGDGSEMPIPSAGSQPPASVSPDGANSEKPFPSAAA